MHWAFVMGVEKTLKYTLLTTEAYQRFGEGGKVSEALSFEGVSNHNFFCTALGGFNANFEI